MSNARVIYAKKSNLYFLKINYRDMILSKIFDIFNST